MKNLTTKSNRLKIGAAFLLTLLSPLVHATSFVVDTNVDEVDLLPGDGNCQTTAGDCSLRAAIEEANALFGDDDIQLPADTYVLTESLKVSSNITITGDGMSATIVDAGGSATSESAFHVKSSANLDLYDLTLTNAESGSSGALYSQSSGDISLDSVMITNNMARGIYIHSNGSLNVTNSVISNNEHNATTGAVSGIGIMLYGSGNMTITDSSITNNTGTGCTGCGSSGGGIVFYNSTGTMKIINSTISGNSISGGSGTTAGGIYAMGQTYIYSSTITENDSNSWAGGVYVRSGTTKIKNTILANNTSAKSSTDDCNGSITSEGYNLIGDTFGCTFTATSGDQVGNSSTTGAIAPGLDALQNNGGDTLTHALQSTSPALNAADPAGCVDTDGVSLSYDQRQASYLRIKGGACDIGAYELQDYCGDGTVDPDEECDDSNLIDGDGCTSSCEIEFCGDGVINNAGVENCDDANTTTGDGCNATCQIEYPPVAIAGPDQQLSWPIGVAGIRVTVNGAASYDPNGTPLIYKWTMIAVPGGSALTTASITNRFRAIASFRPDVRGTYTLQLQVTDPDGYSATDTINAIVTF